MSKTLIYRVLLFKSGVGPDLPGQPTGPDPPLGVQINRTVNGDDNITVHEAAGGSMRYKVESTLTHFRPDLQVSTFEQRVTF